MRRWLFNLAAAMSLVLCLATVVMYLRAGGTIDVVRYVRGPTVYEIRFGFEELCLSFQSFDPSPEPGWHALQLERGDYAIDQQGGLIRVGSFASYRIIHPGSRHYVELPYWLVVIVCSSLLTIWLHRFTEDRRLRRVGRCAKCGYDLRATPDRCPECGAVPGAVPAGK